MQNVATISKGVIGEHAKTAWGAFSVRGLLHRFRRFIETADWDNGHLLNQAIDSASLYLLVAACICLLVPIALMFI